MRKPLALSLVAITVLYYVGLFAGAATYPGYSHIANYASELGAAELVTRANVGLYQRLNSGVSIVWFAVFGLWLLRRDRPA